jgi:hypothetical protein
MTVISIAHEIVVATNSNKITLKIGPTHISFSENGSIKLQLFGCLDVFVILYTGSLFRSLIVLQVLYN